MDELMGDLLPGEWSGRLTFDVREAQKPDRIAAYTNEFKRQIIDEVRDNYQRGAGSCKVELHCDNDPEKSIASKDAIEYIRDRGLNVNVRETGDSIVECFVMVGWVLPARM